MPKYYVLNGHTLGYIEEERPNTFCPLAGKPQLGGLDWKNGPTAIVRTIDKLVPATSKDFEFFRVSRKYHLCSICDRSLDLDSDPLSRNCGGDCWGCVGQAEFEGGHDPQGTIAAEIAGGLRLADGQPVDQAVPV